MRFALKKTILPATLLLALTAHLSLHAEQDKTTFETTKTMAYETRTVLQLLETVHYKNESISEEAFQEVLTNFMGELDDHRLFFLKSDEIHFKEIGKKLGEDLHQEGSLDIPFEIFETYYKRAKVRTAWIQKELETDFDFTIDEVYTFDRSEAPWPSSTAEADTLWRKRLKFELLQELLNDKTIEKAKEKVSARYNRRSKNLDDVEEIHVQEQFLTTLSQLYDPHSLFFSAESLEDFSILMQLSLQGIGAVLSTEDGYCVIKELVPGGPASLSKQLHPNDRIVTVRQKGEEPVDVVDMELRKVVKLIRGKKGTTVELTLIPYDAVDESERNTVSLVRDSVQLNASRSKANLYEVPNSKGEISTIGVIEIPSFYGSINEEKNSDHRKSVSEDVEELIVKLKEANVQGIIMDLRYNGGGLLSEAVELTGLFIRRGPVVQVRNSTGQINVYPDINPKVAYNGPLIVLTSRFSASASEIVAGALQNYGRALIIGDSSTHGKGSVQEVIEMKKITPRRLRQLTNLGATKLTIQKFYLPNGYSTQMKGVISDITIPSIVEYLPVKESDLPNALSWDTIRPAPFARNSIDPNLLKKLREANQSRQETLEEFAFLTERINWSRLKQDQVSISLNLEERQKQKAIDEAFREKMDERQTTLAKLNYPKTEVRLDSVIKSSIDEEEQTETTNEDSSEEKEVPKFDIHLREALRILTDTLDLEPDGKHWEMTAQATMQRKPGKKVTR